MDLNELKAAFEGHHGATQAALGKVNDALRDATARLDGVEKRLNRPGATRDPVEAGGAGAAAEHKALAAFVRSGDLRELKALSVGSDPDGGYLVHPVISASMTKRLFDQSPMRRLARVETIGTGDAWEEPVDADDVGATWVGETEDRPETSSAQVGVLRINLDETYALQKVTQRLLDDSAIDIGKWAEGKITDKFARLEGTAFVTGDGIKKPRGLATYATSASGDGTRALNSLQTVKSGHASEITADGLRNLVWTLRAPYRQGASWLMNSAAANAIDRLKDGQGNYLWRDSATAGAQPSLLGHPVEFAEDMPSVAANALPIAFGNFKLGYVIVDRPGIKWLNDPFTSKPHVLIYAYRRVGGGVANFDAIKLMKIGT